jgi:thioredoxin 1
MIMSKAIYVQNNELEAAIGDGSQPTLVDFYAEWCAPCKMMSPALDELADTMNGTLNVAKVDIEKNPDLAVRYSIGSLPTLMIFVDKEKVASHIGAMNLKELKNWVAQTTGSPAS